MKKSGRRDEGLTKQRIVDAAVEILDQRGEQALTFRTLAARLATGPGAIYWHIANKADLLAEAADGVMTSAVGRGGGHGVAAIRSIALEIFDAIDAHPWVGSQMYADPTQPAILKIMEAIGGPLMGVEMANAARFNAGTALFNYIVGSGVQNAANARVAAQERAAGDVLDSTRRRWATVDPARYPFTSSIVPQLLDHDDRAQFLAGVDLILAGIRAG